MIKWHLEERKISDLMQHPRNARLLKSHQAKHLKKSITNFGLIDKPIINLDNMIIGGHQRLYVLRQMKAKNVECWIPNRLLDEREVDELNIRLNKNTGEWDWDKLANEWDIDDLVAWGFDVKEFDFDTEKDTEIEEDLQDSTIKPTENPKTKLGDIYELGEHRLACGDSTDRDIVSRILDRGNPILMVTDPPYGIDVNNSGHFRKKDVKGGFGNIGIRSEKKIFNDDICDWENAYKLFTGSVSYIWHADRFCHIVAQSIFNCGFEIKRQIIWIKQNGFTMDGYHIYHEPCFYSVKKSFTSNWQGDHKQRTVWEIDSLNPVGRKKESYENNERTGHCTQKPIECMARPIRNNSAEGEGVYDPFVGSGTTLIAAEMLNRKCYAIEIDPAYCDIVVDRWVKYRRKNGLNDKVILNGETIASWEIESLIY